MAKVTIILYRSLHDRDLDIDRTASLVVESLEAFEAATGMVEQIKKASPTLRVYLGYLTESGVVTDWYGAKRELD